VVAEVAQQFPAAVLGYKDVSSALSAYPTLMSNPAPPMAMAEY
jgi:hypothetical protein